VTGVVSKISDTSVSVKTTTGKVVEVGFDAKTTYTRAKVAIQKTDIMDTSCFRETVHRGYCV